MVTVVDITASGGLLMTWPDDPGMTSDDGRREIRDGEARRFSLTGSATINFVRVRQGRASLTVVRGPVLVRYPERKGLNTGETLGFTVGEHGFTIQGNTHIKSVMPNPGKKGR